MTKYQIVEQPGSVSIELTGVGSKQDQLLAAFAECQDGHCSCPTDEYDKVSGMAVSASPDAIAIQLDAKPGTRFERIELENCLDHTLAKVAALD